jgi:hypothetical protein
LGGEPDVVATMTNQQPPNDMASSRLDSQDSADFTNLFASSDSMHAVAKEVLMHECSCFIDLQGSEDDTVAVSSSSSDWSSEEKEEDQELGDFLWEALDYCDSTFTSDELIDLCPA